MILILIDTNLDDAEMSMVVLGGDSGVTRGWSCLGVDSHESHVSHAM